MESLTARIAKKMGLSYQDVDALLKILAFELIQELKNKGFFKYAGLGQFRCYHSKGGFRLAFRLNKRLFKEFNKHTNVERTDEIIFE